MKRQLVLENGEVFIGESFGAAVAKSGEVVFHTGMTGYQEVITDLSNGGHIVTMTSPLIGNSGFNRDDFESITPAIHGLIVKEYEKEPSHWRSHNSLDSYLKEQGIPGLAGIDTRKLTRLIRTEGALRGKICSLDEDVDTVISELKKSEEQNFAKQVSTKQPYRLPGKGYRVVVVDFGVNHTILQQLVQRSCDVVVVPYDSTIEDVLSYKPDGILLSNGPGNPESLPHAIEMIQQLLGKVPLFGIGLGHQLFALACGAKTEKMLYGHRGANYPVRHVANGKVSITKQNHSYVIRRDSLEATNLQITHIGLNDRSVEGVKHETFKAYGVQFIPDSYEGNEYYDQFITMMERRGDN